ncbi:drug/metabolite transporter (DMT)-like permease [Streptomyces violarus]|uniref:Drug/metabolite transporter (DMT)-like permease n=1 Tax=Streptomyces violarus TaxID=67380 RepID=A0A7W5EZH9_9ACTN|nr:DMT family transporter [Streptomyces violarus]MBB3074343.1 drug/metabolite transporter (DMT)-like permease [Streptomyces violarus]
MSALALSVLLSLVSAVAYAGGAIVQERVAESSPGEQYAPLRRPGWWAAVGLNGLGGVLHVVALAFGPLSLVQPLGALTIVVALPMAALFVGRKAGATAWRGAIMATVGLAGLLSLVAASDARSLDTAQRVAVAVVTAGAVVTLMIAARAAHRHPAVRSMLLATASGIAFGMSSVFTKTVAVDWTGGVSAADVPSLAVIGVLATTGMLLSQAAYRGAGLTAPLATLTVVNPVVAAAVGITMFGETFRYGTTGTALALSCGVVAAGGLILLTTERLAQAQPERTGTGLEVAGTGLVPVDTGLGAPEAVREPAGDSGRGRPEPVGAESVGAGPGELAGAVSSLPGSRSELPETVSVSPAIVGGGLAGVVSASPELRSAPTESGALPETVGAPPIAVGALPETVGAPPMAVGALPETVGAPPIAVGALPETVGAPPIAVGALPETVGAPPIAVGALPETVGAPPMAVGVLPKTLGVGAASAGASDRGGTGRGRSVDEPAPTPTPRPLDTDAPEAAPADIPYESGEPPVPSGFGERPLSYVPFHGIPYVPLPTVDRHRTRVRS